MIHVVYTDISLLNQAGYSALYEQASPERKCRADRYRRWEDSLRCIVAEALLRRALGTAEYTLEKKPEGKPYIPEREDFYFNLTHAGKWAAIAYGGTEVGLDVEVLRPGTNIEAIARRFFAPEEQAYVLEEKEYLQQRFLEIWTGKESYLKYLGTGLNKPLTSFSVLSLEPQVQRYHRRLSDGSSLTLCTTEKKCGFEELDAGQL